MGGEEGFKVVWGQEFGIGLLECAVLLKTGRLDSLPGALTQGRETDGISLSALAWALSLHSPRPTYLPQASWKPSFLVAKIQKSIPSHISKKEILRMHGDSQIPKEICAAGPRLCRNQAAFSLPYPAGLWPLPLSTCTISSHSRPAFFMLPGAQGKMVAPSPSTFTSR